MWKGRWSTGLLAVGGVALALSGMAVLAQQPPAVTAHVGALPATATDSSSAGSDAPTDISGDVPAELANNGGTTAARPGARTSEPAPGGGTSTGTSTSTSAAVVADDGFVPDRIRVPSIDVDATLLPVSADGAGVLEPPPDPSVLGWWRGVQPGAGAGSVLVAGHLDSRRYGLGQLQRLIQLEVGDQATVTGGGGDGGDVAAYVVLAVRTYPKAELPSSQLFTTSGPERLVLVTCGGRYDAGGGGWDSNVVAVLERVSTPPA